MTINVLDIFSGCGGLSFGFHNNNHFNVVAANDIWSTACESYKENYPDTEVINKDIKLLTKDDILDKIDIVIGGPPCQSFSLAGNKNYNDERGQLYKEYGRILTELNPRMFLFENVSNLLSLDNGQLFYKIISFFNKLGYRCYSKLLDCSDYGIPTARKRIFLVGIKNPSKDFEFPKQLRTKKLTVYDAISDLPLSTTEYPHLTDYLESQNEYQDLMRQNASNDCSYHYVSNYDKQTQERFIYLPPNNGNKTHIPKRLQLECWKKSNNSYKTSFSRLDYNKPSKTLLTQFLNPTSNNTIHPTENRTISIREGMRIQSFPDDYVLCGSMHDQAKQIGNSVPPLMSVHFAASIQNYFTTRSNCINDDIYQAFG